MNSNTNNIFFLTKEISFDQDIDINNKIEDILKNDILTNDIYTQQNELLFKKIEFNIYY